ncbi:tryptophan synthase subunit alpha [Oscillatoria amoena NRMC-F 0135]|nr:tryptophan synthase subunit alpha [Oscillatoria amoena NRMC-F 0135]
MEITKTNNRIDVLFEEKSKDILSVFYTAGFPKRDDTVRIARELESAGVDMIEIGIPFSDPLADGPIIQHSTKVALENEMTITLLFEQLNTIRETVRLPIVLMGYLNPVLQFGMDRFVAACTHTGVDGVILPDLPADVYAADFKSQFERAGVHVSFLITPATSQMRIRMLDEQSSGFIYAVSASATTGIRQSFSTKQVAYFRQLKEMSLKNPFLIGFGISNQEAFHEACRYGAGAIVGSAFIQALDSGSTSITNFISGLRGLKQPPAG